MGLGAACGARRGAERGVCPVPEAEHPGHLRRRHRHPQRERLRPRRGRLHDAEHRSHRQSRRRLHRLLRPAELHGRALGVHHRPGALPHRHVEGRSARRAAGVAEGRPDHRRAPETAGLRDRPVRQEPPRRPRRVPADGARLRRVLRQPLPPQCRRGAGERGLPEESRVQKEVRAARCDPLHSQADGTQKIEDTGPLTKKRMETIDGEVARRHHRLHRSRQESQQAVLRLVQHHPHAQLHACAEGEPQDRAGGVCRWHDRARRARSDNSSTISTRPGSPTTRSSSTRPTTARWSASGRMPARRRSAARRTPTGKAAGACRP